MKAFKGQAKQRHVVESPLTRMKRRGSLNVFELTAADEILHAHNLSIGAPAARDPDLGIPTDCPRADGAERAATYRIDLLGVYQRWKKDLMHTPALATCMYVLVHERPMRHTERMYRWRNGSAKLHLLTGIRHFAALRGNTPRGARNWKLRTVNLRVDSGTGN